MSIVDGSNFAKLYTRELKRGGGGDLVIFIAVND